MLSLANTITYIPTCEASALIMVTFIACKLISVKNGLGTPLPNSAIASVSPNNSCERLVKVDTLQVRSLLFRHSLYKISMYITTIP